jgi:cytochrome c biogenesis protein CcmG, thiol:disulfide interchange protein DsbE
MSAKSRSARRRAAREPAADDPSQAGPGQSASRWLLPVAGLVIAGVAILAVVLSQSGSGGAGASGGASSTPISVAPPVISGEPLPPFTQTQGDPAAGRVAPTVVGQDYAGHTVTIAPTGEPMLVIFAAHWCPHCQREVPLIQQWIDAGGAPKDIQLRSVSTAITPTAPNYPPEAWFESVGWTVPLIVDPTNTVQSAFGLTSFPFFVLIDGKGNVIERFTGEIAISDLEAKLAAVPRS